MTTTLDTNYLALASKLAYECETCEGNGTILKATAQDDGHPWLEEDFCVCPACDHGKVYPLREKCGHDYFHQPQGSLRVIHEPVERCPLCQGRGWVPVTLGDSTLEAAAAKCGVRIRYLYVNYPDGGGKDWIYAVCGHGQSKRLECDPTDADSITQAKLQALLEVVKAAQP